MPRDALETAFLGVEASITGRRWVGPGLGMRRRAEAMAQGTGLPDPVCGVLAGRSVEPDDAGAYLAPKLRDLMPDPRGLRDAERAAGRLVHAAERGERVAVFADYDVDGATSAALLIEWFGAKGRDVTLYVPDRVAEGYGPNAPAIGRLGADHDLIVCVDCGTMAHEALAVAGCDVVVLDHHLGGETLPDVLAVVNPNRQDEEGHLGHLCAAAVVFLTLVEANRQLRERGREAPDLTASLDLVALATVADVAPLRGVNRAFVRAGLQVMRARRRTGLVALADAARLQGDRRRRTIWASSSAPASTPRAGWGAPTSAPACWCAATRRRPRPSRPGSSRSTRSAGPSRPECATRPSPRPRSAAPWPGPRAWAGIRASWASSRVAWPA